MPMPIQLITDKHKLTMLWNNKGTLERRVSRYQRDNQNPYIEGQTTHWPKEKNTKGQTTIYKTLHRKLKIE